MAQTVIKKNVSFKIFQVYIVTQLAFNRKSRQGGQVRDKLKPESISTVIPAEAGIQKILT
jgi:hypothetical protein